jgi:hypothetical protein
VLKERTSSCAVGVCNHGFQPGRHSAIQERVDTHRSHGAGIMCLDRGRKKVHRIGSGNICNYFPPPGRINYDSSYLSDKRPVISLKLLNSDGRGAEGKKHDIVVELCIATSPARDT